MVKKFRLAIFLILIFSFIVSTFFPQELAGKYFYQALWFKILWAILAISLFIDTAGLLKKRSFSFAVIYGGLLFILLGGLITSFLEEEGFIEIKEGQTEDRFWIEDDLFRPLDFSVVLKDFSVELYPQERKGMRFVKGYKTSIIITKHGKSFKEGVIEVNRPLKFKGYWFYQYGHDPEYPNQTLLQVVKDPGLPFVYSGYLILLLGILTSFKKIWKI